VVIWQIRSGRYPFFYLDEGTVPDGTPLAEVMAMAKRTVPTEFHPVLVNVEEERRRVEAKYDEMAGGSLALTAIQWLNSLRPALPLSAERPCEIMTTGELRRHMQQGGVLVNGRGYPRKNLLIFRCSRLCFSLMVVERRPWFRSYYGRP
jgi:hypothetical protein